LVSLAFFLLCPESAEAQNRRLMGSLREDIRSNTDQLNAAKEHEKRILELRIRHDLGLPVRAGRYLTLSEEESNKLRYADPNMLTEAENETRKLARQLASLQDQIEAAGGNPEPHNFEPIELPAEPDTEIDRTIPAIELPEVPEETPTPAMPGPESQPQGQPKSYSLSSTPIEGEIHLIKGSPKRAEIGRVLLQYGETLDARANALAAEGENDAAEKHRQLANREYLRAKQELDPLVWEESDGKLSKKLRADAELPAMFLLAQCEEKLGNFGIAGEIFLDIKNLDRVKDEVTGEYSFGSWGLAADVAQRVMEFMLEHGEWTPVPSINSIQWQSK
jgi:hypothetical protein